MKATPPQLPHLANTGMYSLAGAMRAACAGWFDSRCGRPYRPPMRPLTAARNAFLHVLVGCLLIGLLSGCAHSSAQHHGAKPATAQSLLPWTNMDLRLSRMVIDAKEMQVTAGRPVAARLFEDGRIVGQAPVNRFTGSFELRQNGTLTWPAAGLAGTRMAGPPEAMDQEQAFYNALASTTLLETISTGVVFRTSDGKTRLEFTKIQ